MKRFVTITALLVFLVGSIIIVRPHLWVKNKTGKVIIDGRLSDDIKLFHGSDDRLLFYLKNDPQGAYVYYPHSGGWRCESSDFASLKVIALSRYHTCFPENESDNALKNPHLESQSLSFDWHEHHYIVSWQAAPR